MELAPISSRRCGLVEVDVTLLKEVCHRGVGFEVSYTQAMSTLVHFLLPVDQDVGLSVLQHICLHATRSCHDLSHLHGMLPFINSCHGHDDSSQ